MDVQKIQEENNKLNNALLNNHIKESLNIIEQLCYTHQLGSLIDEHYNIENAYKSMLKYTLDGFNDPQRNQVYVHLKKDIFALSDKVFNKLNQKYSNNIFYEIGRGINDLQINCEALINDFNSERVKNELIEDNDVNVKYEDKALNDLFNFLWTTHKINNTDVKSIYDLIINKEVDIAHRSVFVSALAMGAITEFNLNKIIILFDLLLVNEIEIKQRAVVSILIIILKYDKRLMIYDKIISRVYNIQEDKILVDNIITASVQMIRTRETEKIESTFRDEIMPEINKMKSDLKTNKFKDIFEVNAEGENPDWQDFFEDSPELLNKLEHISELQNEGADVFMSTFKYLKNFNFFSKIHNWFIPFSPNNYDLSEMVTTDSRINRFIDIFGNSSALCNSDKFSLVLSFKMMPQNELDMLEANMLEQFEQIEQEHKDNLLVNKDKKEANISNLYIQDLYRFYKIHPKKYFFEDVFNMKMDFYNKDIFKIIVPDSKQKRQTAEYLFKKSFFNDALEAFVQINNEKNNDLEIIQKLAYSYQKVGDYKNALKQYLKADIIKPQQLWTIKKIALMYRYIGNFNKAIEYYLMAEKIKPEDLYVDSSLGSCYMQINDFEKALKYLFKVEYLQPENHKIWKQIAWSYYVVGNYDKSINYYNKLVELNADSQVFIHLGYNYWSLKQHKKCIENFKKAFTFPDFNFQEFNKMIIEDYNLLLQNNIPEEDIPIIIDVLGYEL